AARRRQDSRGHAGAAVALGVERGRGAAHGGDAAQTRRARARSGEPAGQEGQDVGRGILSRAGACLPRDRAAVSLYRWRSLISKSRVMTWWRFAVQAPVPKASWRV